MAKLTNYSPSLIAKDVLVNATNAIYNKMFGKHLLLYLFTF